MEIVNRKDTEQPANKPDAGNISTQPTPENENYGGTTDRPYPSPAPEAPTKIRVTAVATYYVYGVKDSTSTYGQDIPYGTTMMESQWIYDGVYTFKDYVLQKIMLDGVGVSELPKMVSDGSKADYYIM